MEDVGEESRPIRHVEGKAGGEEETSRGFIKKISLRLDRSFASAGL
jgi:hypothetical protein